MTVYPQSCYNIKPMPKRKIKRKKTRPIKRFFLGYTLVLVGLAAFAGGVMFERGVLKEGCCGKPAAQAAAPVLIAPSEMFVNEDVDTSLYWKVWSVIQDRHIDKPADDDDLFYGSLEGLVGALDDPYSTFLRPKTAERFTTDLSGKFFGIGAEIGIRDTRLVVVAPLPDTPADRAGLLAGDNIVTIDGTESLSLSIEEAVDLIRGPKGTVVTLGIFREGFDEITDFPITRGEIVLKSVDWEIEGNIAHIKVAQFGGDTMKLFAEAIRDVDAQGVDGVILDLRNNPGGFLTTAVQMASEWIPQGPIVVEKFSDGTKENYLREGKLRLLDMPTVVLVNGGSASGSEIVAGALQDHEKATLVGTQTFGKGSVQDLEQLSDGSAIKITIAEWFTPNNRAINGVGIEPDIIIEQGEDLTIDDAYEKAKELLLEKIK
ncbi:MAG: peptidase S41 [Parcubacteria group bacterium]|nr:peptidase S41 [Parcubacteria group bacterium]